MGSPNKRIVAYVYDFKKNTDPANSASLSSLSLNTIQDNKECRIGEIFPPIPQCTITFSVFKVPSFFVDDSDYKSGVQQGVQQGVEQGMQQGMQQVVKSMLEFVEQKSDSYEPQCKKELSDELQRFLPISTAPSLTPPSTLYQFSEPPHDYSSNDSQHTTLNSSDDSSQHPMNVDDSTFISGGSSTPLPASGGYDASQNPVSNPVSKLKGNEDITNQRLCAWLKIN